MNAGVTEKAVLYSRSRFSWEPSEIGAAKPDGARLLREAPAAFRRLCVETVCDKAEEEGWEKPAAFRRLCVETLTKTTALSPLSAQPPLGGCVLKRPTAVSAFRRVFQPPLGGCVLKHSSPFSKQPAIPPAAFRRLCVETVMMRLALSVAYPAAFRRLCVETFQAVLFRLHGCPAAFRRLCVETKRQCRLHRKATQPPLGGCVLKQKRLRRMGGQLRQPPLGGCVLKPRGDVE